MGEKASPAVHTGLHAQAGVTEAAKGNPVVGTAEGLAVLERAGVDLNPGATQA